MRGESKIGRLGPIGEDFLSGLQGVAVSSSLCWWLHLEAAPVPLSFHLFSSPSLPKQKSQGQRQSMEGWSCIAQWDGPISTSMILARYKYDKTDLNWKKNIPNVINSPRHCVSRKGGPAFPCPALCERPAALGPGMGGRRPAASLSARSSRR